MLSKLSVVCMSVCLLGTRLSSVKTDESIEMRLGVVGVNRCGSVDRRWNEISRSPHTGLAVGDDT